MKQWWLRGTLVALFFQPFLIISTLAWGETLTPAQQEAVRQEVQRILREQGYKGKDMPPTGLPSDVGQPAKKPRKRLEDLYLRDKPKTQSGSTMSGSGSLVYARPFVAAPKAILGGYMDIAYTNRANQGDESFFDQNRLVPFIYGDVNDHVKFAAEIEFEHGNELGIEFAIIDYLVNEPFNVRAGIILMPVGKVNLLHDSPLRDLTERPMVSRRIIPSTWDEPGVGVYGTFYPTSLSQVNYEIYVTSGFTNAFGGQNNPNATSNITTINGLRSARSSSTSFDNNSGKAVVGRVAFSPILGIEIGGSGFFGSYDPGSKRSLALWAVDWTFQRGPFEFIGESAWAYIKGNNLNANGATFNTNPRRMQGYYMQLNYHFLPQWLTDLAPSHFRQEVSTFTAVVRWEAMSLGADLATPNLGERERLTVGLNFRPTEDSVFKTDFQYSPQEITNGTNNIGAISEPRRRIHDTAFLASWQTYF